MKYERPAIVSKLMLYLQRRDPLIYMFLINCDFIYATEEQLHGSCAGVFYKDRRVKFYYNEGLYERPIRELYWIIIHEAFHIFKRHTRIAKKQELDNKIHNYATDMIINDQIDNLKLPISMELKPRTPKEGGLKIPPYFDMYCERNKIPKEEYTSLRLYYWLIKDAQENCEWYTKPNIYSQNENGDLKKEDVEFNAETKQYEDKDGNPVEMEGKFIAKNDIDYVGIPKGAELLPTDDPTIDCHMEKDLETGEEKDLVATNVFSEMIINQTKDYMKTAGIDSGSSALIKAVEQLRKSQVRWRQMLRKNITAFTFDNSRVKRKEKSYLTYLRNPRSNYGIISKHNIRKYDKISNAVIVALDVSGSCFANEHDKEVFFTEVDSIAKELEFSKKGNVFTMQWDTTVREGIREYKRKDWDKYDLKGGGGTTPACVFNHIYSLTENKISGMIKTKEEKMLNLKPNKLPFMIIATDGEFYKHFHPSQLGVYEHHLDKVLFLTRETRYIHDSIKTVKYETF